MTSPLRSTPPSSARSPLRRLPVPGDGEAPAWDRSAATATVRVETGASPNGGLWVQALCWPIVPNAWALLQQAWSAVCASRLSSGKELQPAASWVGESAPQLAAPFRETQAEESSVAALLARTPIRIGVGVCLESADAAAARRQTWAECMGAYGEHLRLPGRSACAVVVARGQDAQSDRENVDALMRARVRQSESAWLQALRLQFLRDETAPLPLEAASLVARAVAEHLRDGPSIHAVLDVAVAKMARVPDCLRRPPKSGKRR
jgi:hypothetical protein